MSSPCISYAPRPDATPEGEVASLASVYGFILACHAKKNADGVTSTGGDNAKEGSLDDSRATASIP
jgi:hypothetical protein